MAPTKGNSQTGPNEQQPVCSKDGKWVYSLDAADKRYVKRIPVDGGSPETVVKSDVGKFALSPDGKSAASFEDKGQDHKLVLRLDFTVSEHVIGKRSPRRLAPRKEELDWSISSHARHRNFPDFFGREGRAWRVTRSLFRD
jgi:hypothetical protein